MSDIITCSGIYLPTMGMEQEAFIDRHQQPPGLDIFLTIWLVYFALNMN